MFFFTILPALPRRSNRERFPFSLLCCNTPCINPGSGWGERFDLRWKHWGPCFNSSADSGLDRTHYWTVVLIRSQKQRLTSVSEIQRTATLLSQELADKAFEFLLDWQQQTGGNIPPHRFTLHRTAKSSRHWQPEQGLSHSKYTSSPWHQNLNKNEICSLPLITHSAMI